MYYKFTLFILKEIESLGLDASDPENYDFIRDFVKEIEIALKENNDNIDYDSFDEQLKMMSDKYHVDFISLDKDYRVRVDSLDGEDGGYDGEDGGYIKKGKWF